MLVRILHSLASRLRAAVLRLRGARIQGHVWLRAVDIPRRHRNIVLSDGAALDRGVTLLVNGSPTDEVAIEIGPRVYINRHAMLDACESIRIGADCMIGPFCYITDHDHTRGSDGRPATGPLRAGRVLIGEGCWLGAHVVVLKGVTIGPGAVIGAGSVVTKDIPAGVTAVGNPARVIASREE